MSCVKVVLALSLGALLTGCGYMWRTIPPGYYDTDPRTRGDRVYETDEYGNVIRQKAVIVRDPSSGNDAVYETDKYGNVRGKKAVIVRKE
jgi:hypothetical protein